MAQRDYSDGLTRVAHMLLSQLRELANTPPTDPIRETVQKLKKMKVDGHPDSAIIDYFLKYLKENDRFPDIANQKEKKRDIKSENLRKDGNKLYKDAKYVDAVIAYNRSACYAVSKENISIALANRSAAFFDMKMYQECLESIRLAREYGYPERLMEKLDKREATSKKELRRKPPQREIVVTKVGLPVNEKIPYLARCLKMQEDSLYGRYVIADEDIPAGTVIAIEEPFCKVYGNEDMYLRCAVCLYEVSHLLIPCDKCCQTMFCSKKCQEIGAKGFHAIECPIMGAIYENFDDTLRLIFRTLICSFLAFPDIVTMQQALEKIEREKKNVFSFDWRKKLTPEELYTPIHTLMTNEGKFEDDHVLMVYRQSCLMFSLLRRYSPVFKERYLTTPTAEDFLKNHTCHIILIGALNIYGLHDTMSFFDPGTKPLGLGAALYAFHSLLSHSCAPNISLVSDESGTRSVTLKNVRKGEQIVTNYGCDHLLMDKAGRQEELKKRYAFLCNCIACALDYPKYGALPIPENIPRVPAQRFRDATNLTRFSVKCAKDGFNALCKYIRKHGHHYPARQLCEAEEDLRICFNIMSRNIPLRLLEKARLSAK
ncbi:SET and MYND domain-containing protein 4-like [Lutzomyia longipalpis]|uniref:SET and MYND domain-containing protein 4-like n=1 Tax=Lutzomyia longipalpis TaxID=7200 RepID=UPI0024842D5F|nr:SET and MYND domain-containing protein 4-like [Lutzomyia longipalpis]XP_055695446.1 SET and MYND domain-containing protein 4-like [Lutzomyia longipalpis]